MKRSSLVFALALFLAVLSSPGAPQAAGPTAPAAKSTASPAPKPPAGAAAVQPQAGGVWKVLNRNVANVFGYPPRIAGAAKDYAPPFFDRLLSVGEDGKYKPELALSWDTSKDGKTITFKLRKGVTFHDGTPFNAQAVKANLDNLIPPKATILSGIASVEVVDDYTVKINLPNYNNLIFHHFAVNPATYMYSPEALKKNDENWALTHPVGTGPFMLKDYQPNISLSLVKNPNYWQKGLPYLNGIDIAMVPDPMTQIITLKAGQAHAIYAALENAVQLRDAGYPLLTAPGSLVSMNFDVKNSPILSKRQVREAIEYAIDKEAICNGPGALIYTPMYQIVGASSPDYNKACPPRKYDPARAKRLLAEAGYPIGFSFKVFLEEITWKEGWVAAQSYLDQVGIKMDINSISSAAFSQIRAAGKIEKGAAAFHSIPCSANTLFTLDTFLRSDSATFPYVVKPAGVDKLIDQAKLSRDPAAVHKLNQQIVKLFYDDVTVIPLFQSSRIAALDKSVQNTGWFMYGDADNNQFGTRTWLKK